jgi:hypothetical protein
MFARRNPSDLPTFPETDAETPDQEMYDLAWSEPMSRLAKSFGISDVALAKTFHQMHVPVLPRGHWARKTAGKSTIQVELPPRPPGLDDHVWIGRGRNNYYHHSLTEEEILGPLPQEPFFEDPMEIMREQLEARVAKVTAPKNLDTRIRLSPSFCVGMKRVGFAALPSGSEYRVPDSGRSSALNTKAAQVELSLADAVHQLNASDRDRRVAELLEPQHHSNALLDAAVVLLNQVIIRHDFR